MSNLLTEGHKDLLNVLIRARISIDDREDPTMLDITTDMRALPGNVTVRQTQPVSDPVTSSGKRIVELNVSYIEDFVKGKDKLKEVLYSLKTTKGVDMIKAIEHDNDIVDKILKTSPYII